MKAYAIGLALEAQGPEPKAYTLALRLAALQGVHSAVTPGGSLALELPLFKGVLLAQVQAQAHLLPGGAIPRWLPEFAGSISASFWENPPSGALRHIGMGVEALYRAIDGVLCTTAFGHHPGCFPFMERWHRWLASPYGGWL